MPTIFNLYIFQDDQNTSICPGTYHLNSEFTMIKVGRVTGSKVNRFDVKLSNKFEVLMEEELSANDSEVVNELMKTTLTPEGDILSIRKQEKLSKAKIKEENIKSESKNVTSKDSSTVEGYQWEVVSQKNLYRSKKEIKKEIVTLKKDLSQLRTPNPFQILEDMDEDILPNLITIIKTKQFETKLIKTNQIKKRCLKKCRHCNFKKRSCNLNFLNCVALSKICFRCGKNGHFPKSMNCKYNRKGEREKKIIDQERKKLPVISMTVLTLVREKIKQLEISESKIEKFGNITAELIPYLTLFILINLDTLINTQLRILQTKKADKEEKSILKTATYCARKFTNSNQSNKTILLDTVLRGVKV